jgi:hypothetical protein
VLSALTRSQVICYWRGVSSQLQLAYMDGTSSHLSNAGERAAAHRTSAVDACYIDTSKLAGLWRHFRIHSIRRLTMIDFSTLF